jgi:hypothetical protein
MLDKKLIVNWCPVKPNNKSQSHDFLWLEPEPLIPHLISQRHKSTDFFKCPAFREHYRNAFVIKSPIDVTIKVTEVENKRYVYTPDHDQEFFDNYVHLMLDDDPVYTKLTIMFDYLFYSKESVIMEQISPSMETVDFQSNINVVPGEYDISKWIRPIEFNFEIKDDTKTVEIKRGDPLYYIKFRTDKTVKLERTEYDNGIDDVARTIWLFKRYTRDNTMEENYQLASSYLGSLSNKIFKKSKCPFHFWKKD